MGRLEMSDTEDKLLDRKNDLPRLADFCAPSVIGRCDIDFCQALIGMESANKWFSRFLCSFSTIHQYVIDG
jgi:hypothetical protein